MADISLQTGKANFNELIGNEKTYIVPPYQRDYSWTEEEWEDLWLDIMELKEEKIHYMGYVVFQNESGKKFQIIDGQQRFATLSIIAISVIHILEDWINEGISCEENTERKELLRSKFLGHKDPASLIPTSKLILNRNNNDFYKSFLLRIRKPSNINKLKPSEKRLWQAHEYFYEKIKKHFDDDKDGETLSRFLNETIADGLVFTTIYVADDINAYKVFETLNARGVRLSTTDLLKNFLFSIVARSSQTEIDEVERQWQNINNQLGLIEFPVFLRHYWNSKNKLERKHTIFKAIKKSINTSADVFKILNDLENLVSIYVAFSTPADNIWDKDRGKHISALSLFNVSQCYPLLLSAYNKVDYGEFTRLLRVCVVISLRYNVIGGLNPNIMEDVYNRAAIKVSKGEITTAHSCFNELKSIYVSDENFKNDFTTKVISTKRSKKLVRYILFSIENQLAEKDYDYEDAKATIEHILPENAAQEWEQFFNPEEQEIYTYRLGNYTIIEEKKNNDCGAKLYGEKINIYKSSAYKLTSEENIYTEWTPETLRKRQEKLAALATSVWRIEY